MVQVQHHCQTRANQFQDRTPGSWWHPCIPSLLNQSPCLKNRGLSFWLIGEGCAAQAGQIVKSFRKTGQSSREALIATPSEKEKAYTYYNFLTVIGRMSNGRMLIITRIQGWELKQKPGCGRFRSMQLKKKNGWFRKETSHDYRILKFTSGPASQNLVKRDQVSQSCQARCYQILLGSVQ